MTLKQFFQLAGGALIGLITYSLPIHPLIKWPFIIFFSLFGAALAFLPFQERPLEQWIIAFFRSVYSPTVFKWKSAVKEEYFQKETAPAAEIPQAPTTKTQPLNLPFVSALEETEGKFLGKLAGILNSSPTPAPAFAQPSMPIMPTPPVETAVGIPAPVPARPEVDVPQAGFVTVPKMVVEESAPLTPSGPLTTTAVSQTLTGEGITASQMAQFSVDAAPPSPPTIPNTISGQVMDPEAKIIEGAILEVRDSAGRPVRAIRSNKVGHFLTVTPLLNGKYEIIIEKEGFIFEPIVLDATGNLIPPIAIKAKGRSVTAHEA